jgi:hypothetical protein
MVRLSFKAQTRDLKAVRARPVEQNIGLATSLPIMQSHRQFLRPQVHEALHGQSRRQQYRRGNSPARAERPQVIAHASIHIHGERIKLQISSVAAKSAPKYLARLEAKASEARLLQHKLFDFHCTKLNSYLIHIKQSRDDREEIENLLKGFFQAAQHCIDHIECDASGYFRRAIDRINYKWVHRFLYDQMMRGDLESSWNHYVTDLEALAFTIGIDIGDTYIDKMDRMYRRARDSTFLHAISIPLKDNDGDIVIGGNPVISVAPKAVVNDANNALAKYQPSAPIKLPSSAWDLLQPVHFTSIKELAEALAHPVYLTMCKQEMSVLGKRLRGRPRRIKLAIFEQTATGLVTFRVNAQEAWFDASMFAALGAPWIQMMSELHDGLEQHCRIWARVQEAVIDLTERAHEVSTVFQALQTTSPSALPAPDVVNVSRAQDLVPTSSDDADEEMADCEPDLSSSQTSNSNSNTTVSQPPSFGSSQFGSSIGSSLPFASSTSTLGSSVASNNTSLATSISTHGQTVSRHGAAAPKPQPKVFANLKALMAALTDDAYILDCITERSSLTYHLRNDAKYSVQPKEYKHIAQGIEYFRFGRNNGLFVDVEQVVAAGQECFGLVVKLRQTLNDLLGAKTAVPGAFLNFRKDLRQVAAFVDAAPKQTSSSLPASTGTSSAVLDALNAATSSSPAADAPTSTPGMGKGKAVEPPAPIQESLAAAKISAEQHAAATAAPDLSSVLLSDLTAGTGPFSPESITDVFYLKAMFKHPGLTKWLSDSRVELEKSLEAGRTVLESRVRPFKIVCSWILHSARQPWWVLRYCADGAEMYETRNALLQLNSEVLEKLGKELPAWEANALSRDIKNVRDRLDGISEQKDEPRKIATIKTRKR